MTIDDPESKQKTTPLEKLLDDKKVAELSEFKDQSKKTEGVNSGFQAKRGSDGHQFMLKVYHRGGNLDQRQRNDNMSFVNEFVMAPFYKRWLYDSTPNVELVKDPKTNGILLRSKYLHEFTSVKSYVELKGDSGFLQISGIERKFAADIMGLELDRHAGNSGLMTIDTERVACKIDHGQSAMNSFTNAMNMWKNFTSYMTNEYAKTVSINPEKLRDSLDQMLKISDEEIERFVTARIHLLKKHGIDFTKEPLILGIFEDSIKHLDNSHMKRVTFKSEKDAVEHYTKLVKQNKKVVKEFRDNFIDVICKMDMPEKWFKRNKWITEIAQKDPIQWAAENNVKIQGKDAIQWAADNSHKIAGQNHKTWAAKFEAEKGANKENIRN